MDLSSIITQVPNPSEPIDAHTRRSEADEPGNSNDPSNSKSDAVAGATGGGGGHGEEETPFSDNNNAGDADGGTSQLSTTPAESSAEVMVQGSNVQDFQQDFVTPQQTGSLQITGSNSNQQTQRPRRRGFFRSLLCCFSGSPTEGNAPPLEPETNGDLASSRLLGHPRITDRDKKCFIIDLDETLVHSSFKPVDNPDFIVPVEIDGTTHQVYVLKRPYVDEFLKRMGQLYECVLFTASLAKYADPVANLLDKWNVFRFRLFREACVFHRGNYVKDLSRLGRDLHKVVILDNSPSSYMFHTENAVQVLSWFDDREDRALLDLIPFFEALARADNVINFLKHNQPPGIPPFVGMGLPGQSLTEA